MEASYMLALFKEFWLPGAEGDAEKIPAPLGGAAAMPPAVVEAASPPGMQVEAPMRVEASAPWESVAEICMASAAVPAFGEPFKVVESGRNPGGLSGGRFSLDVADVSEV